MVQLGKNSGQAVSMHSTARRWLLVFVLLGLAASGTSTYVHYQLLKDRTYTSFCDVSSTVSCTQAYLSPYGSLAGVPVALLGFLWFVLATILVVLALRRPPGRVAATARTTTQAEPDLRDSAAGYLFVWSTIGLAVVLYMAYAAFVILKEVCLLCVSTYIAVAGLFIVSGIVMDYPMRTLPNRFGRDMRRLLTTPVALVVALVFIAGAATAIAFFPKDAAATAAAAAVSSSPVETQQSGQPQTEFERWYFSQPIVDAGVPMDGAKVLIVKFNDYLCPACGQSHRDYQPILAKYQASNPGAVRLVVKDYPLDQECNFNITNGPHQAACEAAAAVRMAEAHGKKDAMAEWLYSNQATATPQSVKEAAATIGGVTDFDAQYPKVLGAIKADVAAGGAVNVRSTPTFIINGRLLSGALPPQFFDQAIALELKRAGVK
jgi:uncharacterized membrane protein/protein-disulfide isomerase